MLGYATLAYQHQRRELRRLVSKGIELRWAYALVMTEWSR